MEEKVIESIVTAFISELVKESKSIFNDLTDEGSALLKGNTPVYLYDIYYPLKLTKEGTIIKTSEIKNVFEKSNYITIIGDAGSGKSTLIKHLFLNSIKTKYAIPILIELRYLNDYKNDLESYINNKVLENKIAENPIILERLLEKGKFVFFLDGYDELNSEIKIKLVENLNSFINKYNENKFILTTRPFSDIEHLQLFHNYHVKKLSFEEGEIEGFVFKQLEHEKELAQKILESIRLNKSEYIQSFLTNPLLLSLYILTFQSNASVPAKKYIFYRRVIQALFSEHDSKTKLGFVRQKLSGLKQEEFEDILKIFCFLSYFEGAFNWDLDYIFEKFKKIQETKGIKIHNQKVVKDLTSAIALWIEDNGEYSFAHRSLQEYFAALFVKNLNPKENERIYTKIIDRFSKINRVNEFENFLSLLEEMDTLNFKRFYYLPLLKELRILINKRSERDLYISFLKFFAEGVVVPNKPSKKMYPDIHIKDDVYRAIYIHLPFTLQLNNALRKVLSNDDCKIKDGNDVYLVTKKNIKDELKVPFINFNKPLPQDFDNQCFEEILPIAIRFSNFIDNEIKSTEEFINKSIEIDKDLVDMI